MVVQITILRVFRVDQVVLIRSFEFKLGLWLLIVGGIVLRRLVLLT